MPDRADRDPPGVRAGARAGGGPGGPSGGPARARPDERFGLALLGELAPAAGNLVLSPASIAAALQMALLGARGATAAQIAMVLHLAGPHEAADGLAERAESLSALSAGPAMLRAPAMMWVQSGLRLAAHFAQTLEGLAVAAHDADFRASPERARGRINTAIEEATAGKIGDLLSRGAVGSDTRLVLANAIYLKADWASPFPAHATGGAPFRTGDGRVVTAPMMRLTARLGYLRGEAYQAVILPYQGDRLALAVILPDGPLTSLGPRLAREGMTGMLAGAAPAQMRLGLPRFRQRSRFELAPVLGRLGMAAAFGDDADFSGITTDAPLAISAVAHAAHIDVDEQGTEAAAATAVGIRALSAVAPPRLEVTVDRPFLFSIIDTRTGLPLFLGQVGDPTAAG